MTAPPGFEIPKHMTESPVQMEQLHPALLPSFTSLVIKY